MKEEQVKNPSSECQYTWVYQVTWQASDIDCPLIDEEEKQKIQDVMCQNCEENNLQVQLVHIESQIVELRLTSRQQLNLGKFVRTLEKQVAKESKHHLLQWECMLVSASEEKAEEDQRIQKLFGDLWSGAYYDLEEGLEEKELHKLKKYLAHRKLGIIEKAGQTFLIDQDALKQEINLNCFACTKKHQYGCCCGSPCGLSDANMTLFDRHSLAMEEAVKTIDEKQYKNLQANGGFMTANGKLRAFDGHCSLLVKDEGVYKCMAHKYALDQLIPIYELCPLSCLMYPLEVIELVTNKRKKVYLLTSVVDEVFAEAFGRWGSYDSLDVELRCIHKNEHNEMFKEADYQPVYEVNKGLIRHEFGEGVYDGLKSLLAER